MIGYDRPLQGYKGGSDSPRQPVEAPDSLVSVAQARIVDLLGEGEIFGLVNGAASIYLDETPLTAYPGTAWEMRNGTVDQAYLPGFPAVESETQIGVTLQAATPWIRAITDLNVSALRINFSVPRLVSQNPNNGDTNGYSVQFAIDVAEGQGAFQEVLRSAFSGKTTGGYQRSVRVDLPGAPAGGWRVRVRRLTPNATSAAIADAVNIQSITEVVDAKFRYPNSAVIGLSFDAQTFGGSIPKRGYHVRGRILRVPSNYDPASRTYSGVWDGTFKPEYSNNPAWIYMDLLLHERFGLGDRVNINQIDKWGLYQIAQYCDGLVDDGRGGQEPRFTCNLYLQTRADALKVLQDVAAIFRGITYWGAGQAMVTADMPSDPVYTYTNANVLGGKFSYKGSKRSTRYSVVLVSWNDPTDMYRAKVEYVQDEALIARLGVRQIDLTAIGCTSQGQAQRAGRWALLTNQYETETVNFSVGLEGIRARPGQIVRVADNARAGKRIGGRLRSATTTELALDMPVISGPPVMAGSTLVNAGSTLVNAGNGGNLSGVDPGDEITVILPSGEPETRTVVSVTFDNVVTVTPAFSEAPLAQSVWAHESPTLVTQRFRIISISESGPLEYQINATKHEEGKFDGVDSGTIISQKPITSIPSSVQQAPDNLQMSTDYMVDQYAAVSTLTITWDAAPNAVRYDVEWKRGESDWVYAGRVPTTEVDVVGVYAGEYMVRVRAMNSLNILSGWTTIGPTYLQGKVGLPPAPVGVTTTSEIFAIRVNWGVPVGAEDTAYAQLQMSATSGGAAPIELGQFAYPTNTYLHTGMAAAVVRFFRVRLIDKSGNIGPWSAWVYGISSADAGELLDYLTGEITETQLGSGLLTKIESGGEAGAMIEELATTVNDIEQGLSAQYSIKLGVNQDGQYYAAGMGIGIENTPDGMQSQVLFLADRFAVLNQINGQAVSPFIIQNGQTIISNAVIGDATISWLKIGDDVQSTNYVAGVSGWRLSKAGGIEFNGTVAGQGRMTINNQLLSVYDSNGVLRVRVGIWP